MIGRIARRPWPPELEWIVNALKPTEMRETRPPTRMEYGRSRYRTRQLVTVLVGSVDVDQLTWEKLRDLGAQRALFDCGSKILSFYSDPFPRQFSFNSASDASTVSVELALRLHFG
jgi:hypothetical protein